MTLDIPTLGIHDREVLRRLRAHQLREYSFPAPFE